MLKYELIAQDKPVSYVSDEPKTCENFQLKKIIVYKPERLGDPEFAKQLYTMQHTSGTPLDYSWAPRKNKEATS